MSESGRIEYNWAEYKEAEYIGLNIILKNRTDRV